MKRICLAVVAAAACMLSACTAIERARDGPAGPVVDAVEQLAVVQIERQLLHAIADSVTGIEAQAPTPAQARALSGRADVAYAAVQVARIAYDVTLAGSAAPATRAAIAAARKETDDAYDGLQRRLAAIISPPI